MRSAIGLARVISTAALIALFDGQDASEDGFLMELPVAGRLSVSTLQN
jgi:hypothetical protein